MKRGCGYGPFHHGRDHDHGDRIEITIISAREYPHRARSVAHDVRVGCDPHMHMDEEMDVAIQKGRLQQVMAPTGFDTFWNQTFRGLIGVA